MTTMIASKLHQRALARHGIDRSLSRSLKTLLNINSFTEVIRFIFSSYTIVWYREVMENAHT